MKITLSLIAALMLPTLALAQAESSAPVAPPPVPSLASDLAAPVAPATPEEERLPTPPSPDAAVETGAQAPQETLAAPANGADGADVDTPTLEPQALPAPQPEAVPETFPAMAQQAYQSALTFLRDGGPSIWAIAALSVITLALILWKIWRLACLGAWSRGKAQQAVLAYEAGNFDRALALVTGRRGVRSKVVSAALNALRTMPEEHAREETARVAKRELASARGGLGALELISTIAPLLGLLGTVMGMIAAFQALQSAGSKADPSMLAGGIWEALLTTAAGMAVAIPASAALTWFEAVIDRIRRDVEDGATRLFITPKPQKLRLAAE